MIDKPYADPEHPGNAARYRTGHLCVEGCGREAGTWWSPLWCQPCNAERIDRISRVLAPAPPTTGAGTMS